MFMRSIEKMNDDLFKGEIGKLFFTDSIMKQMFKNGDLHEELKYAELFKMVDGVLETMGCESNKKIKFVMTDGEPEPSDFISEKEMEL